MPVPEAFRFTLPYPKPTTEQEHEANWRALERWANRTPFFPSQTVVNPTHVSRTVTDALDEPYGDGVAMDFEKFENETEVIVEVWGAILLNTTPAGGIPGALIRVHIEGITVVFDETLTICSLSNSILTPSAHFAGDPDLLGRFWDRRQILSVNVPAGRYRAELLVSAGDTGDTVAWLGSATPGGMALTEMMAGVYLRL